MIVPNGYIPMVEVRQIFRDEHRRVNNSIEKSFSSSPLSIAPIQGMPSVPPPLSGKPLTYAVLKAKQAKRPSYWSGRAIEGNPDKCFEDWAVTLPEVYLALPTREVVTTESDMILSRRPVVRMGEDQFLLPDTFVYLSPQTLSLNVKRWEGLTESIEQSMAFLGRENQHVMDERMEETLKSAKLVAEFLETLIGYHRAVWVYPIPHARTLSNLKKEIGYRIAPETRKLSDFDLAVEWFTTRHPGPKPNAFELSNLKNEHSKAFGNDFGDTFYRNVINHIWPPKWQGK